MCDRCKRSLDPAHELRYTVSIAAHTRLDSPNTDEPADDRDYLMEIHETLERIVDDGESCSPEEEATLNREYDLCRECYRQYLNNPLGVEIVPRFGFSEN